MVRITKAEVIELLTSDPRVFQEAKYFAKYTLPELVVLVEAYGYNDLHCREARELFDRASWSRSLRTNKSLWLRAKAGGYLDRGIIK